MDKLSVKVLRHIKKHGPRISSKTIIEKYGENSKVSLDYLEKESYIKSEKRIAGVGAGGKPVYISTGNYTITSLGLDFLQHKPGNDFDRWLNRISIVLSILGGALLSKPLWTLIEWVAEWLKQYF